MELTNFRDLGGLIGIDGKRIKEKMILRAGEPVGLSKADVAELREVYRLAHIIDFRGEQEVTVRAVDVIEGVAYLNIDILASYMKKYAALSLDKIVQNLRPGGSDVFMEQVYVELVTSEDARTGYRQFIEILLNSTGSLLFHCYHGKDRTGWGAVIILKILGVSEEDIAIDYLATIEGRKAANAKLIETYRKKGLSEEQLEAFAEMNSVKASYLEVAFDTVRAVYGDFDTYLKDALRVTEAEIDQIRALYLV